MNLPFGTTATVDFALADANGDPVEGATVTLTFEDAGTTVLDAAAVTDLGAGNYSYTVAGDLLTKARYEYTTKLWAVKGAFRYYAEGIARTTVNDL